MGTVALLQVAAEMADRLGGAEAGDGSHQVLRIPEPSRLLDGMAEGRLTPDVVVLGEAVPNPVRLVRRICTLDRHVATLVLCPPDQHLRVSRTLRRAQQPRTDVACLTVTDVPTLTAWVAAAVERVQQRREQERVGAKGTGTDAEQQLKFLSEASFHLASSLDYPTTLASVARLAVPRLADWCAVDILEEAEVLSSVAVAHVDPSKVDWARDLRHRYPSRPEGTSAVWRVLRSGLSELHTDVPDTALTAAAEDAEHLRLLRQIGMRSLAVVPLVARGRTLGAISFVSAESGRRFGAADLSLMEELARRAALAVDSARLYRDAQEAAQHWQEAQALQLAQAELGLRGLAGDHPQALMDDAVHRVAGALGVESAAVLELPPAQRAMVVRASTGWANGGDGTAAIEAGIHSQAGYTLDAGVPVIAADLRQETRFAVPPQLLESGAISSITVVIQGRPRPYGILAAHGTRARPFGQNDISMMQGVANVLSTAIARYRSERHQAVQHAVAIALAASAEQDDTLDAILAAVCECLDWEVGVCWLPEATGERMACSRLWQRPGHVAPEFVAVTRGSSFLPGEGLPGRVWVGGQSEWTEDLATMAEFKRMQCAVRDGLHGAFWFPILLGGRVLGVMEFLSREIRWPDENLLQTLLITGRQIGQFVERKRAEAALRASEERLRLALEAGRMGTWEWNIASGDVTWSDSLEAMHGFAPGTFGGTFAAYLSHVHPEDSPLVLSHLSEVVRQGTDHDLEYRVIRPDGAVRWVHGTGQLVRDADGRPCWMIGVCMDVTDRKESEKQVRTLNAQLEHRVAERTAELAAALTELEAFSYSVSHDLRAPLRSIDGFSLALLEDCAGQINEQGQDYLRRIRCASQRMAQLIDVLLHLSRVTRSEMRRTAVDLSSLVRDTVAELQRNNPDRRVDVLVQDGIIVHGDEQLLRLAVENLLDNAWKFTRRRAAARVEFGAEEQVGRPVYFVRDNGAGFDMAYADKLFVAFERLHGAGEFEGVGVGLATVHRIIGRHGGQIWAQAAVDQGATFYFTL